MPPQNMSQVMMNQNMNQGNPQEMNMTQVKRSSQEFGTVKRRSMNFEPQDLGMNQINPQNMTQVNPQELCMQQDQSMNQVNPQNTLVKRTSMTFEPQELGMPPLRRHSVSYEPQELGMPPMRRHSVSYEPEDLGMPPLRRHSMNFEPEDLGMPPLRRHSVSYDPQDFGMSGVKRHSISYAPQDLGMPPMKRQTSLNFEPGSICRKCRGCNTEYYVSTRSSNISSILEETQPYYDYVDQLLEKPVVPELALSPSLMSEFNDGDNKDNEKIMTRSERNQVKTKERDSPFQDEGTKDKLINKKKSKSSWTKMNKELFLKMVDFEKKHGNVKQCEMERIFNVNRSTYWRWKKQYNLV